MPLGMVQQRRRPTPASLLGKANLLRLSLLALGAEYELCGQLALSIIVLTGDGFVPFCLLTKLHTLSDDGFAFQDLTQTGTLS